jgi:hypothetical protein
MVERLGELEVGGAVGGAGAGGFWAKALGTRSGMAIASKTKVRMLWLIVRGLGTKHQQAEMLGRISVLVKDSNSPDGAGWLLPRLDDF